jgi:CBS domain containing-hemolysin-like protein
MSTGLQLLVALLLVLLNGFFVGAEFALVRVRSTRLVELENQGKRAARMALHAIRHFDVYLSATQLGITLASLALGSISEPAVAELLNPLFNLAHLPDSIRHPLAFVLALAIVSVFHMVIGELVPKSYAIQKPEALAMAVAFPLHWFYWTFKPAIFVVNGCAKVVLRLLRIPPAGEHELAHSEEELRMILTASGASGVLKDSEVDLVKHVFEFADKVARDIMVPRVDMIYLDAGWSMERNLEVVNSHTYTRYPLCQGDPDHVLGMIHIKDLVRAATAGSDILSVKREIIFVPETKSIDQLLREFQVRKMHMAAVVDEYGGTAGIVTLEDVLEQIVGEIHDEFEEPRPEIQVLGPDRYIVDGKVLLADLRVDYQIFIQPNGSDTVGGWVLDKIGGIPNTGAVVETGDYCLQVQEMDGQRVRKVLIVRTKQPEPKPSEAHA